MTGSADLYGDSRTPLSVAVVRSTNPAYSTEMVVPVDEARALARQGYLSQHEYAATEYVEAAAVNNAARLAFVRASSLGVDEFLAALADELQLRDPFPGQQFAEWGCAGDL